MQDRDESEGDAAQAFEALRAEVARIGAAVELLAQRQPPDTTVTLGKIVQGMNSLVDRVTKIEARPALRMSPEEHQQAIVRAGREVMSESVRTLDGASAMAARQHQAFAGAIGTVRGRRQQLMWLVSTAAACVLVGLVLSPYLARLLPFGLDSQVAATILKADRWSAGAALMAAGDPQGWQALRAGAEFLQANQTALAACRAAAAKTKKDQHCTLLVIAP